VPLSAASKALGGAFGFSGPAGGSAMSNSQMLINRANFSASGSGGVNEGVATGGQRPGALGLAAQDNGVPQQIRSLQAGDEYREGSKMVPLKANVAVEGPSAGAASKWHPNGTNVTDAVIKSDPALGAGGHLPVAGQSVPAGSMVANRPPGVSGHAANGGIRPGVPTPHQDRNKPGRP